ncbi:unnamed protein product [Pleuronectes platessa]|uniref:Uncharacterized protein n=1 Tax=Pleuronectes platessa TaxID=8262 RepID=A0A9N7VJK6_PLEPL|nr:unnamed protein product [Pleuronectes platessa]
MNGRKTNGVPELGHLLQIGVSAGEHLASSGEAAAAGPADIRVKRLCSLHTCQCFRTWMWKHDPPADVTLFSGEEESPTGGGGGESASGQDMKPLSPPAASPTRARASQLAGPSEPHVLAL